MDLDDFQKIIGNLFMNYPIQKPIDIGKVINDIEKIESSWIIFESDYRLYQKKEVFLLDVVIQPFEKFGLIETIKEPSIYLSDYFVVKQIMMTSFGISLLQFFVEPPSNAAD